MMATEEWLAEIRDEPNCPICGSDDKALLLELVDTIKLERERDAAGFAAQVKITEGFMERVRELEAELKQIHEDWVRSHD